MKKLKKFRVCSSLLQKAHYFYRYTHRDISIPWLARESLDKIIRIRRFKSEYPVFGHKIRIFDFISFLLDGLPKRLDSNTRIKPL